MWFINFLACHLWHTFLRLKAPIVSDVHGDVTLCVTLQIMSQQFVKTVDMQLFFSFKDNF